MIQELINKALLEGQEKRKTRERSGRYSPSSFGRCYRLQWWNKMNEPQSNPPNVVTLRKFKCGNLFHDFVQGYIKPEDTEVEINTPDWRGFADIVTKDAVVDVKSVHSDKFWYMQKSNYNIRDAEYPKWLQVMAYVKELKKDKGVLMFVSKDDLTIAEYVQYLRNWEDDLDRELIYLRGMNTLPPATPRAYKDAKTGKFVGCKYCGWLDKCRSIEGKNHPYQEKGK